MTSGKLNAVHHRTLINVHHSRACIVRSDVIAECHQFWGITSSYLHSLTFSYMHHIAASACQNWVKSHQQDCWLAFQDAFLGKNWCITAVSHCEEIIKDRNYAWWLALFQTLRAFRYPFKTSWCLYQWFSIITTGLGLIQSEQSIVAAHMMLTENHKSLGKVCQTLSQSVSHQQLHIQGVQSILPIHASNLVPQSRLCLPQTSCLYRTITRAMQSAKHWVAVRDSGFNYQQHQATTLPTLLNSKETLPLCGTNDPGAGQRESWGP